MNMLMILFLPLAAHGVVPCPQHMTNTMEIQIAVASGHISNVYRASRQPTSRHAAGRTGHDLTDIGAIGARKAEQGDHAGKVACVESEDLLFYVSSHAQAVSDTSRPTMTPWLELRPIGYVEPGVPTGTSDPAVVSDEHACARSTAHVPAARFRVAVQ